MNEMIIGTIISVVLFFERAEVEFHFAGSEANDLRPEVLGFICADQVERLVHVRAVECQGLALALWV